MSEEEKKKEDEQKKVDPSGSEKNYIEAIEKLKASSVDKNEYDKVLNENKQLLDTLVSGKATEPNKETKKEVDLATLRNELFNKDNTNLKYAEKALQLRKELITRGETDPFLPVGQKIMPNGEDMAAAERVAKTLEECIKYANGDSDIFTTELQRVMVDSGPRRR